MGFLARLSGSGGESFQIDRNTSGQGKTAKDKNKISKYINFFVSSINKSKLVVWIFKGGGEGQSGEKGRETC